MIAISILVTWLALAAAAFMTLSALGRAGARRDLEAQLGALGSGESRATPGWGEPLQLQRPWARGLVGEQTTRHSHVSLRNPSLEQAA
jgi:hypothetical protein